MSIDNGFARALIFWVIWILLGILVYSASNHSPTPPDKAAAQPKPVSNIDEFNEFLNRKKA